MNKIVDTNFLVENAYIVKGKNPFKDGLVEYPTEYFLKLTKSQFDYLRDIGVSARIIHSKVDDTEHYIVKVRPRKLLETEYNPEIPAPSDEMFLERNDIDINFSIWTAELPGRRVRILCFDNKSISDSEVKGRRNDGLSV